jgi:hypothetical protein
MHRQRAGHGDALAHAAGQLRRLAFAGVGQSHQFDGRAHQRLLLFATGMAMHRIHRQADIAFHAEPRQQRIGLEDQTAFVTRACGFFTFHSNLARVGGDESGQQRDQRGLAGAGKTEDRNELAFVHAQIEAIENALRATASVAVMLADAAQFEDRIGHELSSAPGGRPRFALAASGGRGQTQ